jgi:preprotein translocase subunit SecA
VAIPLVANVTASDATSTNAIRVLIVDAFYYAEPRPLPEPPSAIGSRLAVVRFGLRHNSILQHYWQDIAEIERQRPECHQRWQYPPRLQADLAHVKALARKNRLKQSRGDLYIALNLLGFLSRQHLGMEPYSVQLMSVLAMLDGYLIQLAPGEGKTLTIAILAIVEAWSEQPCHVITANEYLAERDAEFMQPLFTRCGLYAVAVLQPHAAEEKKRLYQAPVVYSTAKQLLADFLHDKIAFGGMPSRIKLALSSLKHSTAELLMRGLYTVIVDEADSILIDDATTPLIISMPERNELLKAAVLTACAIADELLPQLHYHLDIVKNDLKFTRLGNEVLDAATNRLPRLWHSKERRHDLIYQAIMARDHFILDKHYVIEDGKVVIVDESTGRTMPGRTWSYGLHQSVEARAGVELTDPSKTVERMSFQNFFKHYHFITGASGTLQNIEQELYYNYQAHVLRIPPRLKSRLKVHGFRCFVNQQRKWAALLETIDHYHAIGSPLLIGTKTIADSEKLAHILQQRGMSFDVLNAKQLAREAEIIRQAGEYGRITVATNMAGRGTDIQLSLESLQLGGLKVIMLEPHDSARVDWQLFGRAGRQGNPGEAMPFVAIDDLLLKEFLAWWHRPLVWLALLLPTIRDSVVTQLVRVAQKRAQNRAFLRRREVNKFERESRDRLSFVRSAG